MFAEAFQFAERVLTDLVNRDARRQAEGRPKVVKAVENPWGLGGAVADRQRGSVRRDRGRGGAGPVGASRRRTPRTADARGRGVLRRR